MTTMKQVEANRRNATLSTGPTSDEGKLKARQNATKHGLASTSTLPMELADKLEQRLEDWKAILNPENVLQQFHVEFAVVASLRIERCQMAETSRIIEIAKVAADSGPKWDVERHDNASDLGATLKRNPVYVCRQLRATPAGRDWMIARWQHLLLAVPHPMQGLRRWTETETNAALDLLGKPKSLRSGMTELQEIFESSMPARELIQAEIASLTAEQANSAEENTVLRERHTVGLSIDTDSNLVLFRRYETKAVREFQRSLNFIKTDKKERAAKLEKPPQPKVEKPVVATTPALAANIPAAAEIKVEPTPIPVPALATPVEAAAPTNGNRLYRKQRQADARHQEYLARQTA